MRRIGILSFSSPGHYYPLTALGRRLRSRGHQVVYFQVADPNWRQDENTNFITAVDR